MGMIELDVDPDRMYGIDMDLLNKMNNPHPWETDLVAYAEMIEGRLALPHYPRDAYSEPCSPCRLARLRRRRADWMKDEERYSSEFFRKEMDRIEGRIQAESLKQQVDAKFYNSF